MDYVNLGHSGLKVSRACLGAMNFGMSENAPCDEGEAKRIIGSFLDQGNNFIDTANVYAAGTSETFLGEFMSEDRERLVLATKFTGQTRSADINASGNSRKIMMDSVHASLRRLKTDYIDLYWVHARDYLTPLEEVMRGLDDLVS